MERRLRFLTLPRGALLCALLTIIPAAAQEAGPIRTMMERSGMVEQYSHYGETFRADFMRMGAADGEIPAELLPHFADVVGEAMDGQRLLREMESSLTETLSPDDAAALTAFYETELGARIREAEIAGSASAVGPDAEQRLAAARAAIASDPERSHLYRRMDDALFASELSTTIAMGLMEAFKIGILQSQEHEASADMLDALEAELSAIREDLLPGMREAIIAVYALMYKDIPIGDLREYVTFLETDAARANYAAIFEAWAGIMESRGREIGAGLVEVLKQKRI
jgi:Uncharacterized protein conserved in bacteria (DUF2059)